MKKLILLIGLFIALGTQVSNAQITRIKKGDFTANIGIGALPTFMADNGKTIIPPMSMTVGYRIGYNFTLSSYIGFSSTKSSIQIIPGSGTNQWQNDFLMVGLRGEVHSDRYDKFDIYGGFMAGYNKPFIKHTVLEAENTPEGGKGDTPVPSATPYKYPVAKGKVLLSGFVGGTYYAMKNIGVFAEVGYGVSILNIGVNFKL